MSAAPRTNLWYERDCENQLVTEFVNLVISVPYFDVVFDALVTGLALDRFSAFPWGRNLVTSIP